MAGSPAYIIEFSEQWSSSNSLYHMSLDDGWKKERLQKNPLLIKCDIQIRIDNRNVIYYYKVNNGIYHHKGVLGMGTIVCQTCEATIAYFEDEKVTTLYGKCDCCEHDSEGGEKE